jgi:hypothetical protein
MKYEKVFVPVSVDEREPPIEEDVILIGSKFGREGVNGEQMIGWLESNNTYSYYGTRGETKDYDNNADYNRITHWLEEKQNVYVMSEEELVELMPEFTNWLIEKGNPENNIRNNIKEFLQSKLKTTTP